MVGGSGSERGEQGRDCLLGTWQLCPQRTVPRDLPHRPHFLPFSLLQAADAQLPQVCLPPLEFVLHAGNNQACLLAPASWALAGSWRSVGPHKRRERVSEQERRSLGGVPVGGTAEGPQLTVCAIATQWLPSSPNSEGRPCSMGGAPRPREVKSPAQGHGR